MKSFRMTRWKRWRAKKAMKVLQDTFPGVPELHGKATGSADLTPVGGWEVLYGSLLSQDAASIWDSPSERQLEQIIKNHSVAWACMRKIVTAAQEAELQLVKPLGKRGQFKEINDSPFIDMFYPPNNKMTYRQYINVVLANILATGTGYTWEWKNKGDYIDEIWPLPKSWVKEVKNQTTGELQYYEVFQGSNIEPARVPLEDMAVMYLPDPTNPLKGAGPLQACTKFVKLDNEQGNYMVEMLVNLKAPGLVVRQAEGWTSEQKDEFRAVLNDTVGRGKRGNALFIEGKNDEASIEAIAPLKDLDWPGFSDLNESRICAAFGVPPILIGVRVGLKSSTYSNYAQADQSFYQETMVPLWLSLADSFSKAFINDEGFGDLGLEYRYYTDDIKQLQEDIDSRTTRALSMFHGSLITRNRALEIVGEDPLPPDTGEVFAVPLNLILEPASTAGLLNAPKPENDEEDDHIQPFDGNEEDEPEEDVVEDEE